MEKLKKLKTLLNRNKINYSQVIYKNSTSKYSISGGCTMELSSKTEEKKEKINTNLKPIIKKYIEQPEKLLQYMRLKGVKIYRTKNAAKILSYFKEEEGFVPPMKGIKAIIFTALISKSTEGKIKISGSTEEMLVFDLKNPDIYAIARALYKYYGFKNNLPGFDEKSQSTFKKFYGKNKTYTKSLVDNSSISEIFAAREAIARDLESINFAIQLSLEHERSKKALNKIILEKNAKI